MSEPSPDREAIDAAAGLTGALESLTGELKRLRAYGRTNRHLIVITFVSIALDLMLTFLLVFTYGTARSAGEAAAAQHETLVSACQAGNQTRAEQIQLWQYVLHLGKAPKTAAARSLSASGNNMATSGWR